MRPRSRRGSERWPERSGSACASKIRVTFLCACLAVGVALGPAWSAELGEDLPKVTFDIPAGKATERLNEFAATVSREAGLSVLFLFDPVVPYRTRAIRGTYHPLEALRLMTRGTPITYHMVNERALTITARKPPKRQRIQSARSSRRARHARNADEVVVLGSQIGGPTVTGSEVFSLSRVALQSTGSLTVAQALRTLPQTFGGGPTEDTTEIGREARSNTAKGVGINLRGLGAGATLALLDGRRLAPGGGDGMFTDVSNIPFIALERVDVLADGASPLYGADAIGGVVNFVLRHDLEGAETAADFGVATEGGMQEYRLSQAIGRHWDGGRALFAFERYARDALPATARRQMKSDLTEFGGTNFDTPAGNPGTLQVGTQTWAIPRGQDGTDLQVSDLIPGGQNLTNRLQGADALPAQSYWSAFFSGRQQLTDTFSLQLDGLWTTREVEQTLAAVSGQLPVPVQNPFHVNPVDPDAPVIVHYNFGADLGNMRLDARVASGSFAATGNLDLSGGWAASARLGYSLEEQDQTVANLINNAELLLALSDPDPQTAFNPFGDGSHTNPAILDRIRANPAITTHSDVLETSFSLSGPAFHVSSGPARLAVGLDYRTHRFDSDFTGDGTGPDLQRRLSRDVAGAYAELLLPLTGAENRRPGLERLELSILGRYEHHEDFGDAMTPRIGLIWSPMRDLTLRGTVSRSFRAPNLTDLFESPSVNASRFFQIADPAAPGGTGVALVWFGNNSGLQEETADSWTAGVDFAPSALPGLLFGATYYEIDFRDRVTQPQFSPDALIDPAFGEIVNANPTAEEREHVCTEALFLSGSLEACLNSPISAILDLRLRNIALLRTRGIDVAGSYEFSTGGGDFRVGLLGTYILDFKERLELGQSLIERVDTQNYPIDFRMRASLDWRYRGFHATLFINYADGYTDVGSEPHRRVRAMTTGDLDLAYTFSGTASGWWDNTRVSLHVDNLWDEEAPFLNNPLGLGYDQENADLVGRIIRAGIQKRW